MHLLQLTHFHFRVRIHRTIALLAADDVDTDFVVLIGGCARAQNHIARRDGALTAFADQIQVAGYDEYPLVRIKRRRNFFRQLAVFKLFLRWRG